MPDPNQIPDSQPQPEWFKELLNSVPKRSLEESFGDITGAMEREEA